MRSFKTIVSLRKANKRIMMAAKTIIYYIQKQKSTAHKRLHEKNRKSTEKKRKHEQTK